MRWIASHGGRGAPHPDARRRLPVPARHQGPGQARPPAPAVRGQPDRLHDRAGRRARQHRPPADARRQAELAAPAHRPGLRLEERSRAHRALPPRAATRETAAARCSPSAACSATERSPTRETAMSERHPIIAITGSSGAGTTSVTRTFENIFRREGVKAAIIEGDSFHRYDRKEMKLRQAEAEKPGNHHFSHFGAENNLFAELEQLFRSYARMRHRQAPQVPARRRGGRALQAGARHLHAVGRPARRHRPAVLRRPARRGGHARGRHRAPPRPADRRGAGHQPGVDPEALARQEAARLLAPRR